MCLLIGLIKFYWVLISMTISWTVIFVYYYMYVDILTAAWEYIYDRRFKKA